MTSSPSITEVIPLSNTSFVVNWIISNPKYSYILITWTNIHSGVAEGSSSIPKDTTNSYTVTGLNDSVNYNVSVTAVDVCEMKTSDPITVYGECLMS